LTVGSLFSSLWAAEGDGRDCQPRRRDRPPAEPDDGRGAAGTRRLRRRL